MNWDNCWIIAGIVVVKFLDSEFIEACISPKEALEKARRGYSIYVSRSFDTLGVSAPHSEAPIAKGSPRRTGFRASSN